MQIFYITFCWNRRLFYDGYIIRDENQQIVGCTDEAIIVGDKTGFREIKEQILIYPITAHYFSENELEDGFTIDLKVKEEQLKIMIRKENRITEKQIKKRVNKVLKTYPEKTQKELIESYLKEE